MASADWIAESWSWAVASSLQATLLLALAWLADRLLVRRVWPQVLLLLWLAALARFFLPPELRSPLSVTAPLGGPAIAAAEFVPEAGVLRLLFALWLAGALGLVALRLARRAHLALRIERAAFPPEWQRALGGELRLATLPGLATPAVFGLFRPTLLVPRAWLARAPTRRDEHVLAHELAHVRRGDLWLDELCACVRALLWFHPLAWLAAARIHELCELACDQSVARALGGEAHSYRDTLVLAARDLAASRPAAGLHAFLGQPNTLVLRIERLERGAARPRALVRGVSAVFTLLVAACVLPMASEAACLRLQARHVLAAARGGERQSCFTVHAAAMVLAVDSAAPLPED